MFLEYAENPDYHLQITACGLFLVSQGVPLNREGYNGTNGGFCPLVNAVVHGLEDLAKAMIHAKADVNIINEPWGETPIVGVVAKGRVGMLRLLLDNGATTDWVSRKSGASLMEMAKKLLHKNETGAEILKILEDHNSKPAIHKNPNKTPKA